MRKIIITLLVTFMLGVGAVVNATPATASVNPSYNVGDVVVVRMGYLPKSSWTYVKEAVSLLDRYTTSDIVYRKWCGGADTDWCLTIYPDDENKMPNNWAAATYYQLRDRVHTDGHVQTAPLGKYIYVKRWTLDQPRENQRGMFAHELGHAFGLSHHKKVNCGIYNGYNSPADIMGNNDWGGHYFRVGWRTFDSDCNVKPGNQDLLRTI